MYYTTLKGSDKMILFRALNPEEQDFLLEKYGTGIIKYFEEKINYAKVKTLHK